MAQENCCSTQARADSPRARRRTEPSAVACASQRQSKIQLGTSSGPISLTLCATADQTVRLFFSSPGQQNATPLPATPGVDVWPFFGSNTSNYVEFVFDDGLDGKYAGLWHMNESVTAEGDLDKTKTPMGARLLRSWTLSPLLSSLPG